MQYNGPLLCGFNLGTKGLIIAAHGQLASANNSRRSAVFGRVCLYVYLRKKRFELFSWNFQTVVWSCLASILRQSQQLMLRWIKEDGARFIVIADRIDVSWDWIDSPWSMTDRMMLTNTVNMTSNLPNRIMTTRSPGLWTVSRHALKPASTASQSALTC